MLFALSATARTDEDRAAGVAIQTCPALRHPCPDAYRGEYHRRRMCPRAARSIFFTLIGSAVFLTIAAGQEKPATVAVQLLAFNDFHGNLEPPTGSNGHIGAVDAGGAEYLATHLATLSAKNPHTL